MMRHLLTLPLLLPLLACTPAQMCRYEATRDLKQIDREIADTSADIARGYRIVEVRPSEYVCRPEPRLRGGDQGGKRPRPRCDWTEAEYRHEYFNIEAERAKLASLERQRDRMIPQVNAALAACPTD